MFNIHETIATVPKVAHIDSELRQIAPQHPIAASAFSGPIIFKFSNSGPDKWFVPSRSFFRIKVALTNPAGGELLSTWNTALAPNTAGNLFSGVDMKIGGETISTVSSNLQQIDALRTRLNRSGSWLNTVGRDTNGWGTWDDRLNRTANDGLLSKDNMRAFISLPVKEATGLVATYQWTHATSRLTLQTGAGAAIQWPTMNTLATTIPVGSLLTINGGEYSVLGYSDDNLSIVLSNGVSMGGVDIPNAAFIPTDTVRRTRIPSERVNEIELIWQPPVSLFHSVQTGIPQCGEWEIHLHPVVDFKTAAVEIREIGVTSPTLGSDFGTDRAEFQIKDMHLYMMEVRGEPFKGDQFVLDLDEIDCQFNSYTGGTLTEMPFNVNKTTNALTVAWMDRRQDSDTRVSRSLFKAFGPYIDPWGVPENEKLTKCYLTYAGRQYPKNVNAINMTSYNSTGHESRGVNTMMQRYLESVIYRGALDSEGAVETFDEWRERGIYFHYRVDKDSRDESTRVSVNTEFRTTGELPFNHNHVYLMLFHHHRQLVQLKLSPDRRVVQVLRTDV